MSAKVTVCELIAWGLDEYGYRDAAMDTGSREFALRRERAERVLSGRGCFEPCDAVMRAQTDLIEPLLAVHRERKELQEEYAGLAWELGVVDLRCVLAFQRRLILSAQEDSPEAWRQDDWERLVSLALGARRSTRCVVSSQRRESEGMEVVLESENPDLQLRLIEDAGADGRAPFALYGGEPSLEVAEFGGRWFLRDGYHRCYELLRAGVYMTPAVIIRARSMEELGATEPWFFAEQQLMSERPPRVMDFLEGDLAVRYERPQLLKKIRIRIEETLEPAGME